MADAAAAPAAEPADDKKDEKVLKAVPQPDEGKLKDQIEEINEKVTALQGRMDTIKETLDMRQSGRGDSPAVASAKAALSEAKTKSRMMLQEKRNIYDQISAADDLKKQQQDLTARLKSQLSLFSVEEIDRKIKALEHQQQTTSMSVKEDKAIMEQIKKLASNKPMIKQYDEAHESLKGVRDHHTTLYTQLKTKNAELTVVKEEEEKAKERLEAAKEKDEAKRADVPSLVKERDGVRKEIMEHRDTIRKLRDEFSEKRKEWQTYVRQQKEIKHKEYLAHKAARLAEYEAQKKAWEEEQAKRDPWEEEKAICEQLIAFVGKYLPKAEEAAKEAVEVDHGKSKPLVKEEADDPYAGLIKKKKGKGKGGGGGGAAPAKPKAVKLAYAPEDFAMWDKLGFKAPLTSDECPELHVQLLAKREWLKTAPPKKKKEEKKEKPAKPAEPAAEEEVAPVEGSANGVAKEPEFIVVKAISDSQVAVKLSIGG